MTANSNNYPRLHNALWPGLVGKGPAADEPAIDLDTMLNLTAAANVSGVKFDGVDLFLFAPHTDIDSSDDDLKRLAEKVKSRGLAVGSLVAPVWPPTGGGSAMGDAAERKKFCDQVRKAFGALPTSISRFASNGTITELWVYDGAGVAVRFTRRNRPEPSRVVSVQPLNAD